LWCGSCINVLFFLLSDSPAFAGLFLCEVFSCKDEQAGRFRRVGAALVLTIQPENVEACLAQQGPDLLWRAEVVGAVCIHSLNRSVRREHIVVPDHIHALVVWIDALIRRYLDRISGGWLDERVEDIIRRVISGQDQGRVGHIQGEEALRLQMLFYPGKGKWSGRSVEVGEEVAGDDGTSEAAVKLEAEHVLLVKGNAGLQVRRHRGRKDSEHVGIGIDACDAAALLSKMEENASIAATHFQYPAAG